VSQVPIRWTSAQSIMRSKAFAAGVADVRQGRAPRFDTDDWDYERGRQWAVVAPMSMPVKIGRRVNPEAVLVFEETVI
jgi:hypothetical protein